MALSSIVSLTLRVLTCKFVFNPVLAIAPGIVCIPFIAVCLTTSLNASCAGPNREYVGNISVKYPYPIDKKNPQTCINETVLNWQHTTLIKIR